MDISKDMVEFLKVIWYIKGLKLDSEVETQIIGTYSSWFAEGFTTPLFFMTEDLPKLLKKTA